jgi:cytidylate kinase
MSDERVLVAVDGAAGSGKTTLSRRLAQILDVPYVNTGLMYRALASAAARTGTPIDDQAALLDLASNLRFTLAGRDPVSLEVEGYGPDELTDPVVEATVSTVARHPAVRSWMREAQRALGAQGAVMEGRDIATVVFPEARVKLFLQADHDARGARRASERGTTAEAEVADALRERDALDARTNPLEPASDAIVLDTGELDIEATLEVALDAVRRVWPASR